MHRSRTCKDTHECQRPLPTSPSSVVIFPSAFARNCLLEYVISRVFYSSFIVVFVRRRFFFLSFSPINHARVRRCRRTGLSVYTRSSEKPLLPRHTQNDRVVQSERVLIASAKNTREISQRLSQSPTPDRWRHRLSLCVRLCLSPYLFSSSLSLSLSPIR